MLLGRERQPGGGAGRICDHLIQNVDLRPTLREFLPPGTASVAVEVLHHQPARRPGGPHVVTVEDAVPVAVEVPEDVVDIALGDVIYYMGGHQKYSGVGKSWTPVIPIPENVDPSHAVFCRLAEISYTAVDIAEPQAGQTVALVSDAGTPGISDPGFYLARECYRHDLPVEALPGPTAFVPALVASALPSDRFVFEGFLPAKKGRQTRLEELAAEPRTMVFYESPYRVVRALDAFRETFGEDRPAAVCREISKRFEEVRCGTLAELAAQKFAANKWDGKKTLLEKFLGN